MKRIIPQAFIVFLMIGFVTTSYLYPNTLINLSSQQPTILSQTTTELLQSLDNELSIDLYTTSLDTEREVRWLVDKMELYTAIDFKVHHQPVELIQQKQYGFTDTGIVLSIQDQHKSFDLSHQSFDERLVSKALFQLSRKHGQWVVFLEGHGEPSLSANTPQSYSLWVTALNQQAFHVHQLNLSDIGFFADNTALLIITSPESDLLPKEQALIQAYLDKGGNLLWLMDFQAKPLAWLSAYTGVYAHPGVVLDQKGVNMGTPHPAITIVSKYKADVPWAQSALSAYPWAQALRFDNRTGWQAKPILETHPQTWTHQGPTEGHVAFNPQTDKLGPLHLGYVLQRQIGEQSQRVMIIGNHRFVTNAAIQNYGNLSIAMQAVNHLVENQALSLVGYDAPKDILVSLPKTYTWLISAGFGVILPLVLIAFGVYRSRRFGR